MKKGDGQTELWFQLFKLLFHSANPPATPCKLPPFSHSDYSSRRMTTVYSEPPERAEPTSPDPNRPDLAMDGWTNEDPNDEVTDVTHQHPEDEHPDVTRLKELEEAVAHQVTSL